ncbi:Ger(x)C family spore germination protein [Neobacillus sp. MM2021_6]|uniref:Ger(x)C family spore germination protein n=1 Tax=Bacillaceae TaxID=186817 RepID=UPI00140E1910|nr:MULTISPECIES: Ger(x)C family spore germination protein [Bacillaceae]MBO0958445.1 Ger(x)C family spore germination protein [Neobacillus sp. MM2021_6]NHC20738.1 Ger(x)C family spore germination protein [Bacillus sp. MM2020_4]
MNKKLLLFFIIVHPIFILSGCWDSMELNERAIELAWGIDQAENKGIQISTQVIIPSKIRGGDSGSGGSQGKAYYVETGNGKDTLDAVQQMQTKLSRQIFRGQRRVIVVGEELARNGIKDMLDTYTRDPSINLLTDIFVIKGGTAKDFLQTSHPLEVIPAVGALKEYYQIGSLKEVGFLNFLLFASSEKSCPTMAAIASSNSSSLGQKANGFRIAGTGIFNKDLKLKGYLNVLEGKSLRWATGNLDFLTITSRVPNKKGHVSIDLNKVGSKIKPIIKRNRIRFLVTLTGQGAIRENNTSLDLTQVKNVAIVKKALEKQAEENVRNTITKVQKEYGTDIFGFSDVIKRKNLRRWKSLKKNWDKEFSEAEVTVKANLTVRKIGVTGKSLIK